MIGIESFNLKLIDEINCLGLQLHKGLNIAVGLILVNNISFLYLAMQCSRKLKIFKICKIYSNSCPQTDMAVLKIK